MGEDLGRGGTTRRTGHRWRAASQQGRADRGLAVVEPLPNPLPGSAAQMAAGIADRTSDAADDGVLEEPPQGAGGDTEP